MEQKFSFTVTLSHQPYALLLKESRNREGTNGAVPSRTARQLIEERLDEMAAPVATAPKEDDKDKPKSKKSKSTKGDVDADESAPTI